jgi:L-amino acid N-acyltransferase YncA
MENIPPEDWPLVLANLHRAVRPGAVMYLTVEEVGRAEIDQAFQSLSARGLPVVRGEIIEGDVAGYHYYPRPQASSRVARLVNSLIPRLVAVRSRT